MEALDAALPPPVSARAIAQVPARLRDVAAVSFAGALALAIHGYQFGKGNHSVYLLDALRHADPQLLANDWFTTQTLQYHAAFGVITRWLYELGPIQPA